MVVLELKFADVLSEMALPNVMKCADDAALQQGEEAFGHVGVGIAAHELSASMFNSLTRDSTDASTRTVVRRFVRHQSRLVRFDVTQDLRVHRVRVDHLHWERTRFSATFNEHRNSRLATTISGETAVTALALAADVRLVHFDGARQLRREEVLRHRVAQTMRHEPRGLVRDAQHAMQLM